MGGHPTGHISAYREMHSLDGDREDVTATFLLIGSEGEFPVEPFQLKISSTW